MPSRTRRYLLAAAIVVTVLTAFGMELGELHWLLFGLLVVADPAGLHSCDQKGCDVCAQLLIWQFSILMPLGFIVLAAMLAPRLIRAVLRPSPPKG
jgi:hypothetical protein